MKQLAGAFSCCLLGADSLALLLLLPSDRLYHRKPISEKVKNWFMRQLRMPLIVFWGRYFSWLPYHDRTKAFLTVVFGAPIAVRKEAEPSDEYIEELWQAYIAQIQGLYEEYKGARTTRETSALFLSSSRCRRRAPVGRATTVTTRRKRKKGKISDEP